MAGVGFDDQPDATARGQFQGAQGARRDMNLEDGASVDATDDGGTKQLQRVYGTFENVACAQTQRLLRGEQNVAGPNGDVYATASGRVPERNFQFGLQAGETDTH